MLQKETQVFCPSHSLDAWDCELAKITSAMRKGEKERARTQAQENTSSLSNRGEVTEVEWKKCTLETHTHTQKERETLTPGPR